MSESSSQSQQVPAFEPATGRSIARVEDAALVSGTGRYMDDIATSRSTCAAAFVRSASAHARILGIDTDAASELPGVLAVLTADEITPLCAKLAVGLRVPVDCWPIAVDRVRYVGEPVAVVIATDRYIAEDAVDLVSVEYEAIEPVVTIDDALNPDKPALHDGLDSNICNTREFCYGTPEASFAAADRVVSISVDYPRNSCTPIETYGIVAEYDPFNEAYDVLTNFQGPFSIHSVLSRALRVPGTHLRLRTPPDSGGSFGVKQAQFPYVVLLAVAARVTGRPVKWIEDRLEHLTASVSATARKTTLRAAITDSGRVLALDWDQVEDVGAFIRAPEPATLYRMHGNMTGAYAIQNMSIRNRIVMTNRTPTGLNRGFGGPQMYFPLERLMQRIAVELELDPLDVIRTNLVSADAFPWRTASGALYDSGDYPRAVDDAVRDGGLVELRERQRAARAEGRLYGIGMTACIEPSVSNMGYITTVMTPEERERAGPKNGAHATATVSVDPGGAVSVTVASVPQGQGHRTVLAQVVGDALTLTPDRIRVVTELDTAKDGWSIASGNYSSRFAAAVCGAAHQAAMRLRTRFMEVAAGQLGVSEESVRLEAGEFLSGSARVGFNRVAATGHWAPGTLSGDGPAPLRETVFWSPPELTAPDVEDRINSSLCHGFIFDFCGVEIDAATGRLTIDKYVTMHDCGRVLHPGMVEGQVNGGFAHAVGAAVYEEFVYGDDGSFLSGTFADYPVPTAMEIPEPVILHLESPSPFTPLGAKGVGEGNCMSTPVCLANAVADATGAADVQLPLTPARLNALVADDERPPSAQAQPEAISTELVGSITGGDTVRVNAPAMQVWLMLLDPDTLGRIVPGCKRVERITGTDFKAEVSFGVGPVRGDYNIDLGLHDLDEPRSARLEATANGPLGNGRGSGLLHLDAIDATTTEIRYQYAADVGGKVAAVGARLVNGATRLVLQRFFVALAREAESGGQNSAQGTGLGDGDGRHDDGAAQSGLGATLSRWIRKGRR